MATIANEKSPSAFQSPAPGVTASPTAAPGSPPHDGAGHTSPVPATTPATIIGTSPAAYHDTKGVPPPQHDAQAILVNKDTETKEKRTQNNDWSHGFWDCFKPADLCFMSCCCPCLAFGKTQARIEDPSLQSYDAVNGPCGIFCLLQYFGGLGFVMAWIKRSEMRRAYNIKGSGAMDFIASCCCPCCVLMQMDKEVVWHQSRDNTASQGYQAPQGMTAVPQ